MLRAIETRACWRTVGAIAFSLAVIGACDAAIVVESATGSGGSGGNGGERGMPPPGPCSELHEREDCCAFTDSSNHRPCRWLRPEVDFEGACMGLAEDCEVMGRSCPDGQYCRPFEGNGCIAVELTPTQVGYCVDLL